MSSLLSIKSSTKCLNGKFNNKRHLWCLLKCSGPLRHKRHELLDAEGSQKFVPTTLYSTFSCQQYFPLQLFFNWGEGSRKTRLCGQIVVSQWTPTQKSPFWQGHTFEVYITMAIYLFCLSNNDSGWDKLFNSKQKTHLLSRHCLWLLEGWQFQPSSMQDILSEMLYDRFQLLPPLSSSLLTLSSSSRWLCSILRPFWGVGMDLIIQRYCLEWQSFEFLCSCSSVHESPERKQGHPQTFGF